MNLSLMIKMTENDKRVIIALLFVVIILFVLIGVIGSIMIRTMKWQGKKCDTLVSDVVTNHIVKTPHQLRMYAAKKNIRLFIKQAWIGIIIILIGVATICIRNAIVKDWTYDPFNTTNGFGTLLFTWNFSDPNIYATFFGKWKVCICESRSRRHSHCTRIPGGCMGEVRHQGCAGQTRCV